MKHPIQNIKEDEQGVLRFVQNDVVDLMLSMLEKHGITLNELHMKGSHIFKEDWDQFNQLIGYSVSGAPISEYIYEAAYNAHKQDISPEAALEKNSFEKLQKLKNNIRESIADIFEIHTDDLK